MLAPWQLSQPEVMPLWLNCAPAKVVMAPLAPASGISIAGTLLMWQLSHASVLGTCAGLRLAIVLGNTPAKVAAVTLAPWQAAQPVVMPLWLKAEFVNLAVFCTGNVRLLLLPTWQVSQLRDPMPMWFAGGATMAKPIEGMA